jgi:hypothetical protein
LLFSKNTRFEELKTDLDYYTDELKKVGVTQKTILGRVQRFLLIHP